MSQAMKSCRLKLKKSPAIKLSLANSVSFFEANQTPSSRRLSASIAFNDASKNVAENVPRLILFAMLASVSRMPCFPSRSASSRYPISARANSAFRNRRARSSHEGGLGFVAIIILPHLINISHIRYFSLDGNPINDMLLPYQGDKAMLDVRGDNRQQKGLEIAATAKILRKGKAWSVPSQSAERRYTVWLDPTEPHCSCPDHEDGGFKCKHIFAVEYVVQREDHPDGSTTVTETLTVRETRERPIRKIGAPTTRRRPTRRQNSSTCSTTFAAASPNLSGRKTVARRCRSMTRCSPLASKSTARFPVGAS